MSRITFGLAFATLIAIVGLTALSIELATALADMAPNHRSLGTALYLHFRFFTILVNWGLALLMIATLVQGLRRRPLPVPTLYGGALIYIVVVGSTYELLLRKTGMRHDIFFFSDMILHDIVPSFYLAFWLGFAPKHGLTWRDAVRWLVVPLVYFAATLVLGALGAGYPYFFVDAARFGYAAVATNALVFLLAFFGLGLGTVLIARVVPQGLHTREPLLSSDAARRTPSDERVRDP